MSALTRGLGRFLLGAVVGAAAGAAAAILTAPRNGQDLRRDLRARLEAARAAGDQAERETVDGLRREFHQHVAKREKEARDS